MTSKEATVNTTTDKPRVVIPIAVSPDKSPIQPPPDADPELVSLYEAHKKIYPRSVQGFFSHWRWAMVWLTQLVFYGLPWLEWGQRQAVLFDLGSRLALDFICAGDEQPLLHPYPPQYRPHFSATCTTHWGMSVSIGVWQALAPLMP